MLHLVPPSAELWSIQWSRLKPPLGEVSPETRHLNLRWSMARLDALKASLANKHTSTAEIAKAYGATVDEIIRLAHEMAMPSQQSQP